MHNNVMSGWQDDLLAHVEDSIENGDFEMTSLIELLAFIGDLCECDYCGVHVPPSALVSLPGIDGDGERLFCEACMGPIREEYARELALCDGSSDDPLQDGFHGVDEECDHAQPVEEQDARQPWAPEGCPVRTRRQA